jgi:hypothetical protein
MVNNSSLFKKISLIFGFIAVGLPIQAMNLNEQDTQIVKALELSRQSYQEEVNKRLNEQTTKSKSEEDFYVQLALKASLETKKQDDKKRKKEQEELDKQLAQRLQFEENRRQKQQEMEDQKLARIFQLQEQLKAQDIQNGKLQQKKIQKSDLGLKKQSRRNLAQQFLKIASDHKTITKKPIVKNTKKINRRRSNTRRTNARHTRRIRGRGGRRNISLAHTRVRRQQRPKPITFALTQPLIHVLDLGNNIIIIQVPCSGQTGALCGPHSFENIKILLESDDAKTCMRKLVDPNKKNKIKTTYNKKEHQNISYEQLVKLNNGIRTKVGPFGLHRTIYGRHKEGLSTTDVAYEVNIDHHLIDSDPRWSFRSDKKPEGFVLNTGGHWIAVLLEYLPNGKLAVIFTDSGAGNGNGIGAYKDRLLKLVKEIRG